MRLPEGWDSELRRIDEEVGKTVAVIQLLRDRMNAEIAAVKEKYQSRMPHGRLEDLHAQKPEAWKRIRERHPIQHPERRDGFATYGEAAEVLAHYWQGEHINSQELLRGIAGAGNNVLNTRAYQFAENLTEPGSPERKYVDAAQKFLWKDYGR